MTTLQLFTVLAEGDVHGMAESLKEWVNPILHITATSISVMSVLIMIGGVLRSVWWFLLAELRGGAEADRVALRTGLGYFILLALELLIVADVIETIITPDIEQIGRLGAIVIIRTVISFTLNWELAKEKQHLQVAKNHGHARPDATKEH